MPKHDYADVDRTARPSSSATTMATGHLPTPSQQPVFVRHHPYAAPQAAHQARSIPPSPLFQGTKPELLTPDQQDSLAMLDSAGLFDDIERLVPPTDRIADHERPFKDFIDQAPGLDLVLQTVAYNVTHGVHIDLPQAKAWNLSKGLVDEPLARQKIEPVDTPWDELGVELPPLSQPWNEFTAEEQAHLRFTALRQLGVNAPKAMERLKALFNIDLTRQQADAWANQDRMRIARTRKQVDQYIEMNPHVTDIRQIRAESGIAPDQMPDREIRRSLKEAERTSLFRDALARHRAGLPYIDTLTLAPRAPNVVLMSAPYPTQPATPANIGTAARVAPDQPRSPEPLPLPALAPPSTPLHPAPQASSEPLPSWTMDHYRPEHHAPLESLPEFDWTEEFF